MSCGVHLDNLHGLPGRQHDEERALYVKTPYISGRPKRADSGPTLHKRKCWSHVPPLAAVCGSGRRMLDLHIASACATV